MATSTIYLNPQAFGIGKQLRDLVELADADDATLTGFYAVNSTTAHRPSTGGSNWSDALLNVARGSYIFQLWFSYTAGKVFKRSKGEGDWTAWAEV